MSGAARFRAEDDVVEQIRKRTWHGIFHVAPCGAHDEFTRIDSVG